MKLEKTQIIKSVGEAMAELEKSGYQFSATINFGIEMATTMVKQIGDILVGEYKETELSEKVCNWLRNNHGKHLCLCGGVGTGKTLMACEIIPILFNMQFSKIFTCIKAVDLHKCLSVAKFNKFVVIDDFGTENDAIEFGQKTNQFNEWIDTLARRECLVIITTNLNAEQIKQRYGLRTYDRIRGLFEVITTNEKSLRK